MSRPASPAYVVPSFATTTNYPAGPDPWAGTPTKVAPPSESGGFVPAQGAAAQFFNYELNQAYGVDSNAKSYFQTLLDAFGQAFVHSWVGNTYPDLAVAGGTREIRRAKYETVSPRWIISGRDAGGQRAYHSTDGGASWNSHSYWTGSTEPLILGTNPAGLTVAVDGFNNAAWYNSPGATSWTAVTLGGLAAVTRVWEVSWFVPTSQFIAVGGMATPLSKMVKGSGTVNWTDVSASIPAAINAVEHWTAHVSPTLFCAIPRVAAGVNYMTSTDLVTFTQRTSLPSVAGFAPRALRYNPAESLWMLITQNASGNIRVYTNPDPVAGTWTLKAAPSLGQIEVYSASLEAAGSMWVLACGIDTLTAGMTRVGCMYSVDSGATWRISDLTMPTGAANFESTSIQFGGGRFMITQGDVFAYSAAAIGLRPAIT